MVFKANFRSTRKKKTGGGMAAYLLIFIISVHLLSLWSGAKASQTLLAPDAHKEGGMENAQTKALGDRRDVPPITQSGLMEFSFNCISQGHFLLQLKPLKLALVSFKAPYFYLETTNKSNFHILISVYITTFLTNESRSLGSVFQLSVEHKKGIDDLYWSEHLWHNCYSSRNKPVSDKQAFPNAETTVGDWLLLTKVIITKRRLETRKRLFRRIRTLKSKIKRRKRRFTLAHTLIRELLIAQKIKNLISKHCSKTNSNWNLLKTSKRVCNFLKNPLIFIILFLSTWPTVTHAVIINVASLNVGSPGKVAPALSEMEGIHIIAIQEDHWTQEQFEAQAKNKILPYKLVGAHRTRTEIEEEYIAKQRKKFSALESNETKIEHLINPNNCRQNRGVTSLFHQSLSNVEQITSSTDQEFRTLFHLWRPSENSLIIIANVYGPNELGENNNYFVQVTNKILELKASEPDKTEIFIIILGDTNAHLLNLDQKLASNTQKDFTGLKFCIETLKLQDTFRTIHPISRQYTWSRVNMNCTQENTQETRIDLVLASSNIEVLTSEIENFNRRISSDHSIVKASLNIPEVEFSKDTKKEKKDTRKRLPTRNIPAKELENKLKNISLPDEKLIEEILNNPTSPKTLGKAQEQVNQAYKLLIKNLKLACLEIFPYQRQETKGTPFENNLLNHKGLKRLNNVIDMTLKLKNRVVAKDSNTDNLIRKIYKYTKGRININLTGEDAQDQAASKLAYKKAKDMYDALANKIRTKEIVNNIKKVKNSKGKDIFEKMNEQKAKTKIPAQFTTFIDPKAESQLPLTLDEAIERYSDTNKNTWARTHHKEKPEQINLFTNFFQAVFNKKEGLLSHDKIPHLQNPPAVHFTSCPSITEASIKQTIKDTKSGISAHSKELINNEILKALPEQTIKLIVKLILFCWETNTIPEAWRTSELIVIPKGNLDPSLVNNYRPIAILSCIYKIFTKNLMLELSKHCQDNNIIDTLQFGSKKDASITQALLTTTAVLEDANKLNKNLYIISLDISKAYDSVVYDNMRETLKYYQVHNKLISAIDNLYSCAEAEVYTPLGKAYTKVKYKTGVRQGCGLSPLLWILYINPILARLRESQKGYRLGEDSSIIIPHVTFVDDITLFARSPEEAQEMVDLIQSCMANVGLRINEKKCTLITKEETNEQTENNTFQIVINDKAIKKISKEEEFALLGITYTANLNWEPQYKIVKKKLTYDAYRLRTKCFTLKQKVLICNALITPSVNYKLNAMHLNTKQCQELDSILSSVIKTAANLKNNHAGCKLWDAPDKGGAGLESITHLNQITRTAATITYGLNHPNEFPKKALIKLLEEDNAKHQPKEGALIKTFTKDLKTAEISIKRSTNVNTNSLYPINNYEANFDELLYSPELDELIFPIWTDGSFNPRSGTTASAVVMGAKFRTGAAIHPVTQGDSYKGELAALELALCNLPLLVKSVIFVDCQAAIDALQRSPSKYSKEANDPARSFRIRTRTILEHQKNKGIPPPTIVKITSHISDKLKIEKKRRNTIANIDHIVHLFGEEQALLIQEGNIKADFLASQKAQTPPIISPEEEYGGLQDFFLKHNHQIYEGNVSKLMKNVHKKLIHQDRLKMSKPQHRNFQLFDLKISNAHLTQQDNDTLVKRTLKLRNLAYSMPARISPNAQHKKIQIIPNPTLEILFPTPLCELCNTKTLNNFFHLHTCPALSAIQDQITDNIKATLRPISNEPIVPFYWNRQTEKRYTPITQRGQSSPKICTCKSERFGEYLKCSKCQQEFHPRCLGITLTIEELKNRKKPFECKACNKKRTYFYRQAHWTPGLKGINKAVPQTKEGRKRKLPSEILLTHALKITTPQNRAKFLYCKENKGDILIATQKENHLDTDPEVALLRRACLGYLPHTLTSHYLALAKTNDITPSKTVSILKEVNTHMINGSHKLYKEYLKLNRKLRSSEGVNLTKLKGKRKMSHPSGNPQLHARPDTGIT